MTHLAIRCSHAAPYCTTLVLAASFAALPVSVSAAAPLDGLAVGRQVKVEGHTRPDGTFDATLVVLRDVDHAAKVEGRVTVVQSGQQRLTLAGFEIALNGKTVMYRGSTAGASRALLVPGAWLEAKGLWRGQSLVAERIRIKEAPEATEELEGVIEQMNDATQSLVLLGRQVRLPGTATIVDERRGDTPDTSALRRDDDDQVRQPIKLGNRVVVGGRMESAFVQTANLALDDSGAHEDSWSSRAQLLASAQLTSTIEAYSKLSLTRSGQLNAPSGSIGDVRVQEAYLIAHRIAGTPFSVQVGRQRFRDSREWFFDEYLDAVRLRADLGPWVIEGAVSDGVLAGPAAGRSRRDQRQHIASLTRSFDAGARLSGVFVSRDDRSAANDDPWWLGGTLEIKRPSWRAWSLGAMRRGTRATTALGGWAADTGATWILEDVTASPSFTLGYAFASGDTLSGDGRDTTFRQTDLEDNSARVGGLRRLAYYGELFDPELTNMQVLTAAVGARPAASLGLDLVLHRYVQTVLRPSFPSGSLDPTVVGRDGLFGHEADAALTFRVGGIDVDLSAGVFVSGPGLGDVRRVAFFWRPQVRLYF